ncbi:MAG: hypothetical protein J7L96_10275 [Bacteroidales bacterium]|nr:hypothetical protein [Bacteroidales bacterium]
MTNSIKKGKRYERQVARRLSEALDLTVKRVPMSGGFATANKTNNPVFRGDLFSDDPEFLNLFGEVVIECKITKKPLSFSLLNQWLDQCSEESAGNLYWLIMKYQDGESVIIGKGRHLLGMHKFEDFLSLLKNLTKVNKGGLSW